MPSLDRSGSSKLFRREWRRPGRAPRWLKAAIWGLSILFVAAALQLWFSREPDRRSHQSAHRAFATALVDGDYDRAFGLFDETMSEAFQSPTHLERYLALRGFQPVRHELGVLSRRVNTVRFTMSDGQPVDAQVRVSGFDNRVVFFQLSD